MAERATNRVVEMQHGVCGQEERGNGHERQTKTMTPRGPDQRDARGQEGAADVTHEMRIEGTGIRYGGGQVRVPMKGAGQHPECVREG